jgi:membrane protease YdiL (CAAX protease family)
MVLSAATRRELGATAAVLAFGAFSQGRLGRRTQVPANLAAGIGAVALARRAGLSWSELGLAPADGGRGLRAGAVATAPLVGAVVLGVGLPVTRKLFVDERVLSATRREALFDVLVRIPIATAVAEELLFRSALLGVASRRRSQAAAVVGTSLVFGAWHVAPALHGYRANAAGADLVAPVGGAAAAVVGTVAVTAGAGVALTVLRLRSRSVVAPIVAHAALNTIAFLAARWAGHAGSAGRAGRR